MDNWTNPAQPIRSSMTLDSEFHRTYTSIYQVISGYQASPIHVGDAGGLPDFGSSYNWLGSIDLWAFMQGATINPEPVEITWSGDAGEDCESGQRALKWFITTTHSSRPSGNSTDPNTARDNPLDDKPVISGSFVSNRVPAFRDKDGNVIQNAAGQVYLPPAEIDDSFDTLRISYNHPTLNLFQRAQSRGTVNSSSIWGLQPRMAKLVQWNYQVLRAGKALEYIRSDFEFLISYARTPSTVCVGDANKFGWYTVLPNSGEYYYEGGSKGDEKKRRKYMDGRDQTITDPLKLDCNGDKLTDQGAPMKWNVFKVEPEFDFNSIQGMPNPLPGPFA